MTSQSQNTVYQCHSDTQLHMVASPLNPAILEGAKKTSLYLVPGPKGWASWFMHKPGLPHSTWPRAYPYTTQAKPHASYQLLQYFQISSKAWVVDAVGYGRVEKESLRLLYDLLYFRDLPGHHITKTVALVASWPGSIVQIARRQTDWLAVP